MTVDFLSHRLHDTTSNSVTAWTLRHTNSMRCNCTVLPLNKDYFKMFVNVYNIDIIAESETLDSWEDEVATTPEDEVATICTVNKNTNRMDRMVHA